MTEYTLFQSTSGPAASTAFGGNLLQGVLFEVTQGGLWLAGWRIWRADTAQPSTASCALWQASGSAAGKLVTPSATSTSGMLTQTWNEVRLSTPIPLSQNVPYKAVTGWTGNFSQTTSQFGAAQPFSAGITNGPLKAYSASTGTAPDPFNDVQDSFSTATANPTATYPSTDNSSYNAWIDVIITTVAPVNATYRLWANYPSPLGAVINSQTISYLLAMQEQFSVAVTPVKLWFYSPPTSGSLPTRTGIWDVALGTVVPGSDNTSPVWSGAAGSGWVSVDYSGAGLTLSANKAYKPSVFNANPGVTQWFVAEANWWNGTGPGTNGLTWGIVTAPNAATATPGQGSYNVGYGTPNTYIGAAENYWVELEVQPVTSSYVPPLISQYSGLY